MIVYVCANVSELTNARFDHYSNCTGYVKCYEKVYDILFTHDDICTV